MYNSPQPRVFPWIILSFTVLLVVGSCSLTTYFSLNRTFSFFESFDPKSIKSEKIGKKEVIAQLNIEGVIMGTREDIFDALEEIEEGVADKKVKGLLIYINSPGGSVAPTQDLYNRVVELKKTIPVVCSMGDVAASGGYYLSAACDEIYALPGTTTGSIGVIFQFFNVENLVNWAKVQPITIKAGKMKDVGSPFRAVAPEERAYLENLLKEVHEQFIRDVAKGRTEKKITLENLRLIADGRIITGEQALKAGLVDKNGGPKDALNWLKVDKKLGNLNIVKLPNAKRSLGGLLTKVSDLNTASQLLDQLHPVNGMLPMLLPANFQSNPQLLR